MMKDDDNTQGIFYVHPQIGKHNGVAKFDASKIIAVKYLIVDGQRVQDPTLGGSNGPHLFAHLLSNGQVDATSQFDNKSNYLIVPADFDLANSRKEAERVNEDVAEQGWKAGVDDMHRDFQIDGREDLQRHNLPKGEVDSIVKDANSWNLGYITQSTRIPDVFAEMGGGALNVWEYVDDQIDSIFNGHEASHKTPSWHFGMDAGDAASFEAGVQAAKADEFHKAVLQVHKDDQRSFAPTFRRGKKTKPPVAGKQQANDEDAHSTILHFMNESPDLFKASSMMSQGDKVFDLLESFEHEEGLSKALKNVPPSPFPHPDVSAGTVAPTGNRSKIAPEDFDSLVRSIKNHAGGFHEAVRRGRSGSPTAFSPVEIAGQQELPSFAPGGQGAGRGVVSSARHAARPDDQAHQINRRFTPPLYNAQTRVARMDGPLDERGAVFADLGAPREAIDEAVLSRAVSDLLDRQARLPPSGLTGFDPGLSPAWQGLKFVV